jgi:hypothetical protein
LPKAPVFAIKVIMYRSFRTILVLLLSLSMAWLPMPSLAAMSDGTPQLQQTAPCHSAMARGDSADDATIDSTDISPGETAHNCCCDGCDSSCDSGCVQGGNMAVLSSDNRVSADKHHAFQVSASDHLNGLTYSPPIPPPLV